MKRSVPAQNGVLGESGVVAVLLAAVCLALNTECESAKSSSNKTTSAKGDLKNREFVPMTMICAMMTKMTLVRHILFITHYATSHHC